MWLGANISDSARDSWEQKTLASEYLNNYLIFFPPIRLHTSEILQNSSLIGHHRFWYSVGFHTEANTLPLRVCEENGRMLGERIWRGVGSIGFQAIPVTQ